jgi:hypothetical protein
MPTRHRWDKHKTKTARDNDRANTTRRGKHNDKGKDKKRYQIQRQDTDIERDKGEDTRRKRQGSKPPPLVLSSRRGWSKWPLEKIRFDIYNFCMPSTKVKKRTTAFKQKEYTVLILVVYGKDVTKDRITTKARWSNDDKHKTTQCQAMQTRQDSTKHKTTQDNTTTQIGYLRVQEMSCAKEVEWLFCWGLGFELVRVMARVGVRVRNRIRVRVRIRVKVRIGIRAG